MAIPKLFCGALAVYLAVDNFINGNDKVGTYWFAVTIYWFINILS